MRVKDAVATCLTEAAGQYLSGETLAQKAGREPKRCVESCPPVTGRGLSHRGKEKRPAIGWHRA